MIHRFSDGTESRGQSGVLAIKFVPLFLLDGLTNSRKRLDAVSGVKTRSVDLMTEPGAFWQALNIGHCPLNALEGCIQGSAG